jgi:hypothetical protein
MSKPARSPLGTPICPYCKKLVTGGRVVLLRSGGQAHSACKHDHEQEEKDERERERLGRKLTKAMDEAMAQGHEAVAELLRKGVKHE